MFLKGITRAADEQQTMLLIHVSPPTFVQGFRPETIRLQAHNPNKSNSLMHNAAKHSLD